MDARRRSLDLTSRRFDLDGIEEVRVGAFARRVRRQRILLGAVGVILAVAAWFVYQALSPDPTAPGRLRPVVLRCAACSDDSVHQLPSNVLFPVVCEKCGAIACRPLWQCRVARCRERFLPPPTGSGIIRCPKCGSDQVGDASP
ncbi:MAG: hypothetical protein AMXMBFR47_16740 [Planctomycetota bacterium]